jgi:LAGLIDADG DNA endonuclease family
MPLYFILFKLKTFWNNKIFLFNNFKIKNFFQKRVYFSNTTVLNKKPLDYSNIKYSKSYKENLKISSNLDKIIIGTLLGDASAERKHANARLKFRQGQLHKDYLLHLYNLFIDLVVASPFLDKSYHKKYDKIYTGITFKTLSLSCLNYYYDLFYKNGTKIVPNNISDLLNPLGLAYWLQDDGGYDGVGGFQINTNSFKKEEVELLIFVLKENFDLKGKLYQIKPDVFVIRFGRKEYPKLKLLVKPFFHFSMFYKLP